MKDGRSPRLLPGFSDHLVKADSDEHSPDGHIITEDLQWRVIMQDKRMKKLDWLRADLPTKTRPWRRPPNDGLWVLTSQGLPSAKGTGNRAKIYNASALAWPLIFLVKTRADLI